MEMLLGNVVGKCCWEMLGNVVGKCWECWEMLGNVGKCWEMLLGNVGEWGSKSKIVIRFIFLAF